MFYFKKDFNKNLEKEVENDVSGNFKRFLVSLMACNRSNAPADKYKAVQQAKVVSFRIYFRFRRI